MRTTISIDDDLLAEAKTLAARQRRTLSDVVQDALRASLAPRASAAGAPPEFELPTTGSAGARPPVDIYDKEALAEAMGDNTPPWHVF
ncbi:type II toxin-antitoxin system VapB family antitoxin [Jatrophihabitans endophyticus]|uniref:type II toxin-antitoxin system VapB family antitoxin n=1 Tax=Jatrophihabitans endophyticus TaxID=1206085 RepID=UPI0019D8D13D|nr:type II toxin-antitoxin system VapB family antitoxin [Jatrophihabitans endophyticus]MBE7187675.1 type II toxin-antitoxin system VapB family antitoxin [Jatrophihabitans endophyticus]